MEKEWTSERISGPSDASYTNCSLVSAPFEGNTLQETIVAVLEREPDWRSSRENSRKGPSTAAPVPAEGREPTTASIDDARKILEAGTAWIESVANRRSMRSGAGVGAP